MHTLAAIPEPQDPRGFLTSCLGDRRHNHGAWGPKWLAVPGSCFGGCDSAVWLAGRAAPAQRCPAPMPPRPHGAPRVLARCLGAAGGIQHPVGGQI